MMEIAENEERTFLFWIDDVLRDGRMHDILQLVY